MCLEESLEETDYYDKIVFIDPQICRINRYNGVYSKLLVHMQFEIYHIHYKCNAFVMPIIFHELQKIIK